MTDKAAQPQPPAPNPLHRFILRFSEAGRDYKADYVAAERRAEHGIMGGRIVQLLIWRNDEPQPFVYYDQEWIREPNDAEGRMVLRKLVERVR